MLYNLYLDIYLDFNDVLKLEPDNRQAKQELESMKKEVMLMFMCCINR